MLLTRWRWRIGLWLCFAGVVLPCVLLEALYRWGVSQAGALPEPPAPVELLLVHRAVWAAEFRGSEAEEPQWPWSRTTLECARLLVLEKRARGEIPRLPARPWWELAVAAWFSRHFTAEEALVWRAEHAWFGWGFVGVEAAAHGVFGKPAAALVPAEAAVLAGVLQSPRRYFPCSRPEAALKRRAFVLRRMREEEVISTEEEVRARAAPLGVRPGLCAQAG